MCSFVILLRLNVLRFLTVCQGIFLITPKLANQPQTVAQGMGQGPVVRQGFHPFFIVTCQSAENSASLVHTSTRPDTWSHRLRHHHPGVNSGISSICSSSSASRTSALAIRIFTELDEEIGATGMHRYVVELDVALLGLQGKVQGVEDLAGG